MLNVQIHRSSSSGTDTPPTSRSYFGLQQQQQSQSPLLRRETSQQQLSYPDTLESAFSRLNVNSPYSYGADEFFNGSFHHGNANAGFLLPNLDFLNNNNNQDFLGLSNDVSALGFMGLQNYGFVPPLPLYPTSNNNNYLVQSSPSLLLRDLRKEHNESLSLNHHHRTNGGGGAVAVGKNQNVLLRSSSGNSNLNGGKRPQWLQEPFDCLRIPDLRGNLVTLSKDQYGCRYLQRTMGGLPKEEIDMIYSEVLDHVCELMVDPFGNYVVQKLVDVCTEEQRTQIILMLTKIDFLLVKICLNMHGTRAVQKLLERLTTSRQISLVTAALSAGAVALTKDMNGHHVIQHCLKHFSVEDNKYLLNEVAENCYGIATDKSGCCVLQQCVEYSKGEQRARLVAEIIANALLLAEDRYGNYVVQHLLVLRDPQITANLLRQLERHFISLSRNKFGSNVVEKCLAESGERHSMRIVTELLSDPNVSTLLLDPYGNYVIQSALTVSKGFVYDALVFLVKKNFPMMRSNIYGKKVLAWFERRKLMLHK